MEKLLLKLAEIRVLALDEIEKYQNEVDHLGGEKMEDFFDHIDNAAKVIYPLLGTGIYEKEQNRITEAQRDNTND